MKSWSLDMPFKRTPPVKDWTPEELEAHRCRMFRKMFWLLAGLNVLVMAFFWQPFRLSYNHTPSAPLGFYMRNLADKPPYKVGDMVAYRYAAPDWALRYGDKVPDGMLFLKNVGAVPGEYLLTKEQSVFACPAPKDEACRLLGVRKLVDRQGSSLPQTAYDFVRIPAGMYWFISGDAAQTWAFDSRYLGLIPAVRLEGKAFPVYTW